MKVVLFLLIMLLIGLVFSLFLFKSGIIERIKYEKKVVQNFSKSQKEEILNYLTTDKDDAPLKFEVLDNSKYIRRRFKIKLNKSCVDRKYLMGRGSWRATQGNIYSYDMLEKDIENEFSKSL